MRFVSVLNYIQIIKTSTAPPGASLISYPLVKKEEKEKK